MATKFEDIRGFLGLEYIVLTNVPIRDTQFGEVIDVKPNVLENITARAIITHRVPIRGKEVKFLRKTLGLSLERFASEIKLTSGSIFKWERAADERLHPINEIAVRAFVAEQLNIDLSGKYSELVASKEFPKEIVLNTSE